VNEKRKKKTHTHIYIEYKDTRRRKKKKEDDVQEYTHIFRRLKVVEECVRAIE